MPLYLTEEDIEAVLTIGDALEAVEGSFRRQAAGDIENSRATGCVSSPAGWR